MKQSIASTDASSAGRLPQRVAMNNHGKQQRKRDGGGVYARTEELERNRQHRNAQDGDHVTAPALVEDSSSHLKRIL